MKKVICTTTIYPPSKALLRFIQIAEEGWEIIVVGDQKTDHQAYRNLENQHSFLTYLSPGDQESMDYQLSEAIGWNCIQRRNFAFLQAHRQGADIIASIDDDNIPKEGWGRDLLLGHPVDYFHYLPTSPVFDPLSATNHEKLWHRGFPIQLIADRRTFACSQATDTFQVQADFWDGDPDVDAICRMVHRPECKFENCFFPFASSKVAPFNSQNTFLLKEVLPHYFMMPHVGRSDDIWPSFHVQAQGFKVIFGKASVTQERNAQDVMKNFEDELLNYRYNLSIIRAINAGEKDPVLRFLPDRARLAFDLYQKHFS